MYWRLEDLGQLLERAANSFDREEVPDMTSDATQMNTYLYWIFFKATGVTKVLAKASKLPTTLYMAIPFARVALSRHSACGHMSHG